MEKTIFSEKQERLVQCINYRKHIYQVLWDEKPVETEDGGVQYSYQYTVFKFRPTLEQIKEAVIADINERTRQRIVSTLTWNGKPVWLSIENQMDWKAAYDNAVRKSGVSLPVKLKLGEQEDGTPVYHTFTSLNAFGDFNDTWQQHIMQCLADGYALKDGIDWSVYGTEEGTGEEQGE